MAACVMPASREDIGRRINSNLHQLTNAVHPQEFFEHIHHGLHRLDAERIQKGFQLDKPDSTLVLDMYMYLKRRSKDWPMLIIDALRAMDKPDVICSLGISPSPGPHLRYSQPVLSVAEGGGPAFGGFPGGRMGRDGGYQTNAGPSSEGYRNMGNLSAEDCGGSLKKGCARMADDGGFSLKKDEASLDEGYTSYRKGCPPFPSEDVGDTNPAVNRSEYNRDRSEGVHVELREGGAPLSAPTRDGDIARLCSPNEQRSGSSGGPQGQQPGVTATARDGGCSEEQVATLAAAVEPSPSGVVQRTGQMVGDQRTAPRGAVPPAQQACSPPYPTLPTLSPPSASSTVSSSGQANEDTNDLDAAQRHTPPVPCTPVTNVLQSMEDNRWAGTSGNMTQSDVEDKTAVSEDREPKRSGEGEVQEDADLPTTDIQSEPNGNAEPVFPEPEQTSGSRLRRGSFPRTSADTHHLPPVVQNITLNFNIDEVKNLPILLGHTNSAASPPQTSSSLVNPTTEDTGCAEERVECVPAKQGRGDAASGDSSNASTTSPGSRETMAGPLLHGTENTSVFPRQPQAASTWEAQPGSYSGTVSAFCPSEIHHQTQVKTICQTQEEGDVSICPRECGMAVGLSQLGANLRVNWPHASSPSVNFESELELEDEPTDCNQGRTSPNASHTRCRSTERRAAVLEIMTSQRDSPERRNTSPAVTNGRPNLPRSGESARNNYRITSNTHGSSPANSPGNLPGNTQIRSPTNSPGNLPGNTQTRSPTNPAGIVPTNTQGNIPTFLRRPSSSASSSSSSWISSFNSEHARLLGPESLQLMEEESQARGALLRSGAGTEQ